MFQKLSNDIMKSSIQWVLTPIITLWKFRSPLRLQFPKWEFTWECGGSFPHTLLHSREHEMLLMCFTLGPNLCKPLPWSRAQGEGCDNKWMMKIPTLKNANLNVFLKISTKKVEIFLKFLTKLKIIKFMPKSPKYYSILKFSILVIQY